MQKLILAVDQSTQGTKAVLFNEAGEVIEKNDKPHRQLIDENGWVEHDPEEIIQNTLAVCREVLAGIDYCELVAMGITNQRETVVAWDRETGEPLYNAIVWQCSRARELCSELSDHAEMVRKRTGLNLSPYFSAAKVSWMIKNIPAVAEAQQNGTLCCGTVDSWLIFKLTRERAFRTDVSNASRTQLMNIYSCNWDESLCNLFGIAKSALPEICMSDALFGTTDLGGILKTPIPICGVLGDSHGALLAQGCRAPGDIKATYGTGSSVMMQTGQRAYKSENGLVTSVGWGLNGKVSYVLEGNLNYAGAVVRWMREDAKIITSDADSERLAEAANPADRCYFVPAFTGLGAPYWDSEATGMFTGITRTTGQAELVKAGLESIGYQIDDLVQRMVDSSGIPVQNIRVDGGPTRNRYLMQFQSNITGAKLLVSEIEELSAMGAAMAVGMHMGIYCDEILKTMVHYSEYLPVQTTYWQQQKRIGWQCAIRLVLTHETT